MKKMTFMQKIKFVFQNMKIDSYIILVYPFISIFIFVGGLVSNLFDASFLTYFIITLIVFLIHFLAHVIEAIGILIKKVTLIDGNIFKIHNDYVHRVDHAGTGAIGFYNKKYVSLISNSVKERRVPIPGNIRIKVQSDDKRYISPWSSVTKRVFKNKDKYRFMIITYNDIPVSVYREKR